MKAPSSYELLTDAIREQCAAQGWSPDRYDPDFLLGIIVGWLAEHDAMLTSIGIEPL